MKVGIVGSGLVGATAAYALVMRGVGREIVLVDKNAARAAAEADDIRHAVPFAHPLDVRGRRLRGPGRLPGRSCCAPGSGRSPGETRLQLLRRNAAVFREVVPGGADARAGRGARRRDQPGGRDDAPGRAVRGRRSACPPGGCSAPAPRSTRPGSAACSAATAASMRTTSTAT